ncbi:MAG: hypothetical protein JWL77_5209 [Chthonomonadaceae bacterium]|nr:hypothetical protein [Chthonomonadaceae bacterium]
MLAAVTPQILSGKFFITGDDKVAVHGILIGLLKPAGTSSEQELNGFFLVTGGSGPTASAFGSGRASIDGSRQKFNRFDASLDARLIFAPLAIP